MALKITSTAKLLSIREFRYGGRRTYLESQRKIIDKFVTEDRFEFEFMRSLLFPVDTKWPNRQSLQKKVILTMEAVDKNQKVLSYYRANSDTVVEKLNRWNGLAKLGKAELTRKVEGSRLVKGYEIRKLKLFGNQFVEFVALCAKYPDATVIKIVKEVLNNMSKAKWDGVITPKVCLAMTRYSKIEGSVEHASKLKELSFGEE